MLGLARESDDFQGRRVLGLLLLPRRATLARPCPGSARRGEVLAEPAVELAQNVQLRQALLGTAQRLIEERQDEIRSAWKKHLGRR